MSRGSRARGDEARLQVGEHGLTLVELSVAMAISLILAVALASLIEVFTSAEASTVNGANAASDTRLALLQLQHDIQSANPVDAISTTNPLTYEDELQVTIQPSNTVITWTYSAATQELTRQAGSSTPIVELTNVTNGSTLPVFHYYDHCFNDLVAEAQASGASPSNIAQVVTVIQVTLAVTNVSTAPYGSTTSVNIMSRQPGFSPCA